MQKFFFVNKRDRKKNFINKDINSGSIQKQSNYYAKIINFYIISELKVLLLIIS